MTYAEVLVAYKYQPNLERCHVHLKGTQLVAPKFLRDPARIEALLCADFIAMLISALIERQVRTAMADIGLTQLISRGPRLPRNHVYDRHGEHVQTFPPAFTDLQCQVPDLLNIPRSAYATVN